MATVRYVGPHDEVFVPLPLGGEATVARGETFDTSDEHAESLCQQVNNWQPVREEKKAPAPAPASPERKKEEN